MVDPRKTQAVMAVQIRFPLGQPVQSQRLAEMFDQVLPTEMTGRSLARLVMFDQTQM